MAPPQSIKAEVMAGTLLSSGKGPVAPPPFDPDAKAKVDSPAVKAAKSAAAKSDGSSSADSAPPKDPPALVAPGASTCSVF